MPVSLCLPRVIAMIWYLRPWRWYTYTDDIKVKQVARDADPGYALWEEAESLGESNFRKVSSTRPSFLRTGPVWSTWEDRMNDDDLFCACGWDQMASTQADEGAQQQVRRDFADPQWGRQPASFRSSRPGGQGGQDIWVSKWDGVEYAWPLPLVLVNTPFDEIDPAITPDSTKLFFSSIVPIPPPTSARRPWKPPCGPARERGRPQVDFDLFSRRRHNELLGLPANASKAFFTPAPKELGDARVMTKLGGTEQSEKAVDKALAYLVSTRRGRRWDIQTGGGGGHDRPPGFSLLAFYGRGERRLAL